jgi:hypothetical protein
VKAEKNQSIGRRGLGLTLTDDQIPNHSVLSKARKRWGKEVFVSSRSGRTIHRHRDQELLDQARKIANSPAAGEDLKRRQHLIERSFADAANCHGLKRARWRGLWKQAIQDLLIATVQNLRKLVRHLSQTHPELVGSLHRLLRRLSLLLMSRSAGFSTSQLSVP